MKRQLPSEEFALIIRFFDAATLWDVVHIWLMRRADKYAERLQRFTLRIQQWGKRAR